MKLTDPASLGLDGICREVAYLAVDMATLDEEQGKWLSQQPVPIVGVGKGVHPSVDLVVEDATHLPEVADKIEQNPRAAAVLVDVLRVSECVTPLQALAVESLGYATLQGGKEFVEWLASAPARTPKIAGSEVLQVDRQDETVVLTLNDVARRNALSVTMRDALTEAFEWLAIDTSVQRVVLQAAGPNFCAGGDLSEFGGQRDLSEAHYIRMRQMPARGLISIAERCEARLHGACIGAGIELPAFAQQVVARRDATFRLPEVGMGLIPGAGGCVSIPRRIGRHRAAWLAITGNAIDAQTALEWGLVDRVVDQFT